MEGFALLSVLSLAMFAGSYIFGSVPLVMTLSESRARIFSVFGAGLLVGTALSVIIPEGVQSIYDGQIEVYDKMVLYQQQQHIDVDNLPRVVPKDVEVHANLAAAGLNRKVAENHSISKREVVQSVQGLHKEVPAGNDEAGHGGHEHGHDHDHNLKEQLHLAHKSIGLSLLHLAHKSIGLSLVIGFIVMLLIDQISRSASSGGVGRQFKITATIGLVVHAAADGVALASASAINKTDVQFIVFAAIMLHKGPAAFGLVSFLLAEGLEAFRVKRHLLVFSLSAPVAALVTYYTIATFGLGGESLSSGSTTGVLMLFSAGTFLYVATVHVLSELVNNPKSGDFELVPTNASGHSHSASGLSLTVRELLALVIGAVCPTIIASGHSH
uniref:Zinc transporter ZIP9 n=1 Tax=Steinernema glaseri TaxID=37863 RepID=A0A1I7ZJ01_9BILA